MDFAPLAEVTRGGRAESLHSGSVAVVDLQGRLLHYAGDPNFVTFTRSTLKPFQALPFLRDGGAAHFGYGRREIALLCASHSGEPMHVDTVASMLRKAGCDEHHLLCGCHTPLHYAVEERQPNAADSFSQLHNNCSGKHAGFLAYCMQHGEPLASYIEPGHPLQRAIRQCVADVAGIASEQLHSGIDGCSAPNHALPLARLALLYARLAQGEAAPLCGRELGTLFDAMTGHPELVSGTGRSDLAFMQAGCGDWVAKVGAEGVQAIGIRSAGLGIALKVADGNARALYPATVAVLRQLGLLTAVENTPLAPWVQPRLRNYRGVPVGEVRAAVKLVKN